MSNSPQRNYNAGYCDSGIYDLQSNTSATSSTTDQAQNYNNMKQHNDQPLSVIKLERPLSRSEEFLAKCLAAAPAAPCSNVMWPPSSTCQTFSQTLPTKAAARKNSKRNPVTNDLVECFSMEEFPPPPKEFRI